VKVPPTQGLVALILAVGASFALIALAVAAAVAEASSHLNISEGATSLLSTAFGAVIGAVATYVGTTRISADPPPPVPPAEPPSSSEVGEKTSDALISRKA